MFHRDYALVTGCRTMVEDTVWVKIEYVRPRLGSGELADLISG
jgi:hypothetical protein